MMYSLSELMRQLKLETLKGENQERINFLAIEIASRIYIPNDRQTYEDLLNQLGYQDIKKKKLKK